jgi:predicted TIM-barrel fold metal-dependent hydrolase
MHRIVDGEFVPAMDVARAHARPGNIDAMIEWLTRALHERSRLVRSCPACAYLDDQRYWPIPEAAEALGVLTVAAACRTCRPISPGVGVAS